MPFPSNYPKLNTLLQPLFWSISSTVSFFYRLAYLPMWLLSFVWPSERGHSYAHDPHDVVSRWVGQLEEAAGVRTSHSALQSHTNVSVTGVAGPGPSTIRRRHEQIDNGRTSFPKFFLGSYEDALRTAQADSTALCVILVSDEHDDYSDFVSNTLTDVNFNNLLKDNNMIVWGGDVKDYEAHQASEKLTATTFPFVAFIALQPRSGSSSQRNSSGSLSAVLTVLSRHEGPAWDGSNGGPTSAAVLCDHLSNHLLPRVNPFLERMRSISQERQAQQLLRQQQDEAFALTARLDREKMDAKLMAATQVDDRKSRYDTQMAWYRYARSSLVTSEPTASADGVRISVKLQDGRRFIRNFRPTETLTSLYAFVASHLIPPEFEITDDPVQPPPRLSILGETPWSFQLALSYPRKKIPWDQDRTLSDVPELRGGQLVVEYTRHDIFDDGSRKETGEEEEDYVTDDEA